MKSSDSSAGWFVVAAGFLSISRGGRSALWPLSLGECFGVRQLGALLGWLNIAYMLGNSIGPFLGGYIFDATGSYRLLFILCIGFSLVSSVFISHMRDDSLRTNPQ
jgi:MFS family permease